MKKTSHHSDRKKVARSRIGSARVDRAPYAARLKDKTWMVTLDPDLVDLLSGTGGPGAHLLGFVERRNSQRERRVLSIPLTDLEYAAVRDVLERIGAEVTPIRRHADASRAVSKIAARTASSGQRDSEED